MSSSRDSDEYAGLVRDFSLIKNEDTAVTERRYQSMRSDKVENVEEYRKGGYYPIHIGDILTDTEGEESEIICYKIIHKLGFGGFSTVWLARDLSKNRYVAVKILKAQKSDEAFANDLKVVSHLYQVHSEVGDHYIQLTDHHFFVNGVNGRCLCLVSGVGGPSIAQLTQRGTRISIIHARRIALQLTQCVSFLHSDSEGIGHGDLTSNNVLLELDSFDHWTQDEVYERLGRPKRKNVRARFGHPNYYAPHYLVESADLTELSMFTGNIRVIDFGGSFFLGDPPGKVGTPLAFRAPEIHFNRTVFNRKASDVWALACTIYEIRAGLPLFEVEFGDESSMEAQIIAAIGQTSHCTFTGNPEDTEMPEALDYLPLRGLVDIIDGNIQRRSNNQA